MVKIKKNRLNGAFDVPSINRFPIIRPFYFILFIFENKYRMSKRLTVKLIIKGINGTA